MKMLRTSLLFGLMAGLLGPGSVFAQGLDIEPIAIDISEDQDQLVLAALPMADQGPIFSRDITSSAGTVRAAVRQPGTLPKPSIILGLIAPGAEADFGVERLLPATVNQISFSWDDLAARESLRADDPDLFGRLVSEGHIDPDPDQLSRVLQTELQRMNCYRSGIDGLWGGGSQRSVMEYFDQLASVSWDDPAPTFELFRALLLNGDVECPTPAVAATSRAAPSAPASNRTPQRTTPARTAPAAKPAAPAPKPKLSIGAQGVFR